MNETSKCFELRKNLNHFDLYLKGKGIDIGCGSDILKVENGTVDTWDLDNGDAMLMSGIEDNTYDFVYSSHCLEHLQNVETALKNWTRILKDNGSLYFVIPEFVLYEKMNFPSIYNTDHKQTFSCYIKREQTKRENHYHTDDILNILKNLDLEIKICELQDHKFDYNIGRNGDQTMGDALAQILFVAKKKEIVKYPLLDVVIVSYAKNESCENLTIECIKSLLSSEEDSEKLFNIIVVESNPDIKYEYLGNNIKTYEAPLPYGYHKFLNYGRKKGNAKWVALCNNDLIFNKEWFTKILKAHKENPKVDSFSPMCPLTQNYNKTPELLFGYQIRRQLSGWCLVHKRSIYEKIGDLDENFIHWCCDSDFSMVLFKNDIKHALVTSSIVYHHNGNIGKTTENVIKNTEELHKLTSGAKEIFYKKYPEIDLNIKMYRNEIINKIIKDNNYKSYLEIGINDGINFEKINCDQKIGVDPKSTKATEIKTSDDFFNNLEKDKKFDIIFIDGLHLCEQVNRDLENSFKHLNKGGTIVVHDTNPPSEFCAKEEPYYNAPINGYWTGDVYKSIIKLRENKSNIEIFTVDTDWGVTVITEGHSKKIINPEYSYEYFERNKKEILNLISIEEFMNYKKQSKSYKIGLCMIVKNEGKIIERCLNSVKPLIDFVYITDTGSTDNTIETINKWMEKNQVDGIVEQETWKNFAHNRTVALEKIRNFKNVEYTLMIDADEILSYEEKLDVSKIKDNLTCDLYYITCKYGGIEYARTSITKNEKLFYYKGVVHEFLECASPDMTRDTIRGIYNIPIQDSARNEAGKKFEKDICLLEEALKTEQDSFMKSRYTFYLAQSYRDSGNLPKSIYYYEERAKMGNWNQEVYISLYQIAKMKEALEYPQDDIVQSYLRAYEVCPERIEALHGAVSFCRKNNRNHQAFMLATYARSLPVNKVGLFVETWIWDYGMDDEYCISAYWSNHYKEGLKVTEELVSKVPERLKPRILLNLSHFQNKLKENVN